MSNPLITHAEGLNAWNHPSPNGCINLPKTEAVTKEELKNGAQSFTKDDVINMLVESCEEVYKNQAGLAAGNTITRPISHSGGDIDVKEIRKSYGLTQDQFASAIYMTPSTIKQWEQGLRTPKGTSRIVLEAMAIVAAKRFEKSNRAQKNGEDVTEAGA